MILYVIEFSIFYRGIPRILTFKNGADNMTKKTPYMYIKKAEFMEMINSYNATELFMIFQKCAAGDELTEGEREVFLDLNTAFEVDED